jgi:hypothetical protein
MSVSFPEATRKFTSVEAGDWGGIYKCHDMEVARGIRENHPLGALNMAIILCDEPCVPSLCRASLFYANNYLLPMILCGISLLHSFISFFAINVD